MGIVNELPKSLQQLPAGQGDRPAGDTFRKNAAEIVGSLHDVRGFVELEFQAVWKVKCLLWRYLLLAIAGRTYSPSGCPKRIKKINQATLFFALKQAR